MWRDVKYLLAYLLPLAGFLGLYFGGVWSPGSIYVAFVALPLLELVLPASTENHTPEEESERVGLRFFDYLLYVNLPVLFGIIYYFLHVVTTRELTSFETVAMVCNVGLLIGTIGINVGHELGHRDTKVEQWMAQALLLTGHYLHFFIEHNRGHHRYVATPEDPATSRRNEPVYFFWARSTVMSYLHAWQLDPKLMIRFQAIQLAYLTAIFLVFGWAATVLAIWAGIFGFLMLETVNYIEHYGLLRRKEASGRYEAVLPVHSWNSDHELGRIFLYELTRHSDHHFRATRKYQILRRFEESPQLPAGYPMSMLLALLPPVWFAIMNPRLPQVAAD